MSEKSSEEQLLEFLYACPVGLIECNLVGDIGLMNPHAMQHLLPLAGGRDAGNLFTTLEQHAPELRSLVADRFQPFLRRQPQRAHRRRLAEQQRIGAVQLRRDIVG